MSWQEKYNPYIVKYIYQSFFRDYNSYTKYKSVWSRKIAGNSKMTDVKCIKYNADEAIYYKLALSDEYQPLPLWKPKKETLFDLINFPRLYRVRLNINLNTFSHVQELKMSCLMMFTCFMIQYHVEDRDSTKSELKL